MLVKRTVVFPIECVIRGYLSGSAWKEYKAGLPVCGVVLPVGLRESERFEPPMFTPATKAEEGHDENISVAQMAERIGAPVTAELERLTRLVYDRGQAVAVRGGILLADTKFEFGRAGERILLVDEVLTPDSSRFWPADGYEPGRSQASFDKQPLRDYLDGERHARRWNGDAPPPPLPPEVVAATSARYLDAFRRLTGAALDAARGGPVT
jgi:phosphoribosylaminoimidazole-succinocarboxamide synthase